ncbi:hypothetical protein Tco_1449286 [Tanacetum coccineum]
MLNKKLQADRWNEMCYQLLKLMTKQEKVLKTKPTELAQLDTKGVLGEVVITCERSQADKDYLLGMYCGIESLIIIRGWQGLSSGLQESRASDADYYTRALMDYEAETGTTFGGGSKRYKSSGSSSFNTESVKASINLNGNVGDNEEDEVHKIRRPMGRDKVKDAAKKKGSRASGSSSANDETLARLMVTKMTIQKKEERLAFLEIKRREVECRERHARNQKYRQRQDDIRFYLQPYDFLTGDARLAMEELRAEINAKYDLPY